MRENYVTLEEKRSDKSNSGTHYSLERRGIWYQKNISV